MCSNYNYIIYNIIIYFKNMNTGIIKTFKKCKMFGKNKILSYVTY